MSRLIRIRENFSFSRCCIFSGCASVAQFNVTDSSVQNQCFSQSNSYSIASTELNHFGTHSIIITLSHRYITNTLHRNHNIFLPLHQYLELPREINEVPPHYPHSPNLVYGGPLHYMPPPLPLLHRRHQHYSKK